MSFSAAAARLASALRDALPDSTARVAVVPVANDPRDGLSEDELAQLTKFPVAKRRREWAAGRVAAKQALVDAWPPSEPLPAAVSLRIEPDPAGRPIVSCGFRVSCPVGASITHAGAFAAAVAFSLNRPLGLDLEPLVDVEPGLASFVCAPTEAELLEQATERFGRSGALVRIWVAKEAAVKLTGTGLAVPLGRVVLERTATASEFRATAPATPSGESIRCRVRVVEASGYAAALAWAENGPRSL